MLKINLDTSIDNIAFLDFMEKAEVVRRERQYPDIPEDEADNSGE